MKIKEEDKDLNYWKNNCEDDYLHTPISVLRYITKLEEAVNNGVLDDVNKRAFNVTYLANDEIIKGLTVLADSEEEAMHKALLLRGSKDIYSAIEVNVC
jgi:hypothetical protein